MIQIEVTFCAWQDNTFGNKKSTFTLQESVSKGATLDDLFNQLIHQYSALEAAILDQASQQLHDYIIVIVNGKFFDLIGGMKARLGSGDRVQVLPCIAGG